MTSKSCRTAILYYGTQAASPNGGMPYFPQRVILVTYDSKSKGVEKIHMPASTVDHSGLSSRAPTVPDGRIRVWLL